MTPESVKITEIFYSLQGETSTVGLPTTFVRLTGCPLRCVYCDTAYAFHGGERLSLDSILDQVATLGATRVTVTGGEPLAQRSCLTLLTRLCDKGYSVSLETSGALSIADVDRRVAVILDLKTPASGEVSKNDYGNIPHLKPNDEVKFVLADRRDYDWAVLKIDELGLSEKVDNILFSPTFGQLSPAELSDWVVADKLAVRVQLQLHKLLWNDEPGR